MEKRKSNWLKCAGRFVGVHINYAPVVYRLSLLLLLCLTTTDLDAFISQLVSSNYNKLYKLMVDSFVSAVFSLFRIWHLLCFFIFTFTFAFAFTSVLIAMSSVLFLSLDQRQLYDINTKDLRESFNSAEETCTSNKVWYEPYMKCVYYLVCTSFIV